MSRSSHYNLSIIIVLFFLYYDSCTMVRATFSIGEAFSTHLQNLISRTPFKKRTPTVREEKPLSAQLQTSQKNQLQTSAHVTMQPSSKVLTYNANNSTPSDGENSMHQLYGPHSSTQLDIKKYRQEKKRILQRWDSCNDSNKKLFLSNASDNNESDTDQPTWVISIELKNGNFKKAARKQNVSIDKLPSTTASSIPHQENILPERKPIVSTSNNNNNNSISISSWSLSMDSWIIFLTISLLLLTNFLLFLMWRWKSAPSEVEDQEIVELVPTISQTTAIVAQPAIIPIPCDPIRPTIGPKLKDYDSHLLFTPLRINRRQIQPSSSGFERGSLHSISSNNSNSSRSNSNSNSNSSNSISMSAGSSCKRFTPLPYPLMVPSSAHDTLLPFSSASGGGGGSRKKQSALSSSSFDDSPCKLSLQMGLLTPPMAERGMHRHLHSTTTSQSHSVRGLLPAADADIGDLSDIYECNDVINESTALEEGGTSLLNDTEFADSHLDISELYKNTDADGSNDRSGGGGDGDENDSTPSKQNSLADELASFFVDDNPALEALQLRQLSLPGAEKVIGSTKGNHRSPSNSPCSLKTPLSENGILSTSFNHEYIIGDGSLPKEQNNLDLSKESIDVHHEEAENDNNNMCIAKEEYDGGNDSSSIYASPASFQEDTTNPVVNRDTPMNILTVRTSSTTKYDEEGTLGFSISNDCDKENHSPSEIEDTSFEMKKKIEPRPSTPPEQAASVVVEEVTGLQAHKSETVEEPSCESTAKALLDPKASKLTLSEEQPQQQQQQHIDCSRSCSTRSIEYMAVERHYIDLNLSDSLTMSADSCDDSDSVVPGFSKSYTSDGDDNETINLVRRPSINKIIEIELQSYVQQQLLHKEQMKSDSKKPHPSHIPPVKQSSSNKSGNNFAISNPKRSVPLQKQKQYGALSSTSGGIGIGMEARVRRASFSASGARSRSRSPPPLPFEAIQKSPASKNNSTTTLTPTSKSKSVLNSIHGQIRKVAEGVMNDLSPTKSTTVNSNSRKVVTGVPTSTEKPKKDVKYRKKS